MAWLCAALRPTGPYPLLAISGEQGSVKTVLSKMLRALVDPNAAPLRSS
jgi:ABC-type antimicrobial peptide transport system ATPase subunit